MKYLVVLCLMVVSYSHAATIAPGKGVQFLALDGKSLETKTAELDVEPGSAQLVVKYNRALGSGNNKRVFDSYPFIITLEAAEENLEVIAPKVYSYEQAVKVFKNDPQWKVMANGQEVDAMIEELAPSGKVLPFMNIETAIAEYNNQKGIAVATAVAPKVAIVDTQETKNASKPVIEHTDSENLGQLKAWYKKATKEEQKEFRRWLVDYE